MHFFLCLTESHILVPSSTMYLDAVDDMLLLGVCGPIGIVRADNVDGWGGRAPLDYVHYVIRV